MRVDALFFRTGLDGNPLTTHQLLLVLRNIEVDCSSRSARQRRQTSRGCQFVADPRSGQGCPGAPSGSGATGRDFESKTLAEAARFRRRPDPPRTVTGRGSGDQIVYADVPPASQASDDEYVWLDASKSVLGPILRYLVWPAVAFLMLKTLSGTIRGARRCRKIVTGKEEQP